MYPSIEVIVRKANKSLERGGGGGVGDWRLLSEYTWEAIFLTTRKGRSTNFRAFEKRENGLGSHILTVTVAAAKNLGDDSGSSQKLF